MRHPQTSSSVSRPASSACSTSTRPPADALIAELREHPVTAATLAEAHRWAREAVAGLDTLPNGPVKKALIRFADTIVERSS